MKLQINDWEEPHLPQISQHDHVLCLADQKFPAGNSKSEPGESIPEEKFL